MARPTSSVGICNLSLDLLKEAPISNITAPETKVEEHCARWYDVMRQMVLEAYNWNFALLSANINRVGDPEDIFTGSSFSDYYALPNNYLKLRAIVDPRIPLGRRVYEIQGRNIFYSYDESTTLPIWYTKDETTVTTYPALFIKLLSEELALVLGKKITARPSIMKDIREDRNESRRLARAVDGQVRPPRRYENSRIVSAGFDLSARRTVAGDYEFEVDPN